MSNTPRSTLLEEIERKLNLFLKSDGISDERKVAVLRELLAIAIQEQ